MKVIKSSKLVDANGVVKDPILVINEGIIEDVGPDVPIPDDAEVIDAGELTARACFLYAITSCEYGT